MRIHLATLLAAVVTASGLAVATPATAATPVVQAKAAATPKRTDGFSGKTVLFIHGWQPNLSRDYSHPKADCKSQWKLAKESFAAAGVKAATMKTVAYYKGDTGCDVRIGSYENGATIKTMGKALAKYIYDNYTKKGKTVDVVAHSMGGLILRAAITGVSKKESGFPSKIYVEDAVTMGTPHQGSKYKLAGSLCRLQQCKDMSPGSSFLKWLDKNGQSTQGTDWTLIGSTKDGIVAPNSSVSQQGSKAGYLAAGHKVIYQEKIGHSNYYNTTKNTYRLHYWNKHEGKSNYTAQKEGQSPVVVARNAAKFWRTW